MSMAKQAKTAFLHGMGRRCEKSLKVGERTPQPFRFEGAALTICTTGSLAYKINRYTCLFVCTFFHPNGRKGLSVMTCKAKSFRILSARKVWRDCWVFYLEAASSHSRKSLNRFSGLKTALDSWLAYCTQKLEALLAFRASSFCAQSVSCCYMLSHPWFFVALFFIHNHCLSLWRGQRYKNSLAVYSWYLFGILTLMSTVAGDAYVNHLLSALLITMSFWAFWQVPLLSAWCHIAQLAPAF